MRRDLEPQLLRGLPVNRGVDRRPPGGQDNAGTAAGGAV